MSDLDARLDRHLVQIVNGFRDTDYDRRVDVMSMLYHLPPWLILRIGHDARLLSDAEQSRYAAIMAAGGPA